MAHTHRTGVVDLLVASVKLTGGVPTNTINVGDLVAMEANKAVPATAFTWTTDLATTRTNFAVAFLGVSSDRSRAGTTDTRDLEIGVDTDGNIEFDCASASYVIGDYLAPQKAVGNALVQTVEKVAAKAQAIAVVVKDVTGTKVLARPINTFQKR